MEIYDFIDSTAIANHLRSINYAFSATQKAFLIALSSKATIKAKHAAFREIIQNDTDTKVERRFNTREYPSLFGLLERYMAIEDELIEEFYSSTSTTYRFRYHCNGDGCFCEDFDTVYPTLDSCVEGYKEDIASYPDDIHFYEMRMDSLFEIGKSITLKFTPSDEILSIDASLLGEERSNVLSAFEGMWFDIPTPFKRGDVLISRRRYWLYRDRSPVVLDSMSTWSVEEFVKNGHCQTEEEKKGRERLYNHYIENGDVSDMNISGYFVCEDGDFYRETSYSILDYEYFDEPKTGGYRMVQVLSDYLKGELDIEELLKLSKFIMEEERLKDSKKYIHLTDDYLKKIGVE